VSLRSNSSTNPRSNRYDGRARPPLPTAIRRRSRERLRSGFRRHRVGSLPAKGALSVGAIVRLLFSIKACTPEYAPPPLLSSSSHPEAMSGVAANTLLLAALISSEAMSRLSGEYASYYQPRLSSEAMSGVAANTLPLAALISSEAMSRTAANTLPPSSSYIKRSDEPPQRRIRFLLPAPSIRPSIKAPGVKRRARSASPLEPGRARVARRVRARLVFLGYVVYFKVRWLQKTILKAASS